MSGINYLYPEFEVERNDERCIRCRVCERQCANEVHFYDADRDRLISDESKCVNCQRCVSLCPTRALKIVRSDCRLRENANWDGDTNPIVVDYPYGEKILVISAPTREGYEFDAVILEDSNLYTMRDLTPAERLERIVYLSDDRNVTGKFVRGEKLY